MPTRKIGVERLKCVVCDDSIGQNVLLSISCAVSTSLIYRPMYRRSLAQIRARIASKRRPHLARRIPMQDVLNARIRPCNQDDQPNAENQSVQDTQSQILSFVPLAFLQQVEPEQGREVEGESA